MKIMASLYFEEYMSNNIFANNFHLNTQLNTSLTLAQTSALSTGDHSFGYLGVVHHHFTFYISTYLCIPKFNIIPRV